MINIAHASAKAYGCSDTSDNVSSLLDFLSYTKRNSFRVTTLAVDAEISLLSVINVFITRDRRRRAARCVDEKHIHCIPDIWSTVLSIQKLTIKAIYHKTQDY